jgi:predicted alpha/beta hydrolase family esterase
LFFDSPLTTHWFTEELATASLDDKRLDEWLAEVPEALGNSPNASIPAALGGRAELKAAYRFFDNEKVTPAKLIAPHFAATANRCRSQKVVLVAQDDTELAL